MNVMRSHRAQVRGIVLPLLALALSGVLPVGEAAAQQGQDRPRTQMPRGGRPIDHQVQRQIGAIMKQRLELTDEQLRQLEAVTVKLEPERRAVRAEEFRLRMELRTQLMAGDSVSSEKVAELLDRMPKVERRRIDLMEAEQRELAQFLTPVQRARYVALQEQIRRNMDDIRDRRPGGAPGRPSTPGRPPMQKRH